MTHLQSLRDIGQSLWLDNITREILDDGTLQRYIDEYGITGLTSNPTIFDQAIGDSSAYDAGIREKAAAGKRDKGLFRSEERSVGKECVSALRSRWSQYD